MITPANGDRPAPHLPRPVLREHWMPTQPHPPQPTPLLRVLLVSMKTLLTGWLGEHNDAGARRPARRASMTTLLRQHGLHLESDKSMISTGRRS